MKQWCLQQDKNTIISRKTNYEKKHTRHTINHKTQQGKKKKS